MRKQFFAALVALLMTVGQLTVMSTSASAAASHENTDPYRTGCTADGKSISSKAVSGGTVSIMVSAKCGTNWVRYSGVNQKTTKYGRADGKAWTQKETDTAATSFSFQSYAPGTTGYTGVIQIGTQVTTATCSNGCTWKVTDTRTRETRAVDWANSKIGSTEYAGFCQRFVENAYGTSGRYPSALAAFEALKAAGTMKYTTTNIPKGALVFTRNSWDGGYGHVMISRGDGSFVEAASKVRVVNHPAGGSGSDYRFLGWSPAPASWPGR
ncbi:DUF2690 domain-containing protein [Ornithinimicrobium sp. Y1847]|uniref:DUF2690 domain-containing protein n=1 Tax=Ornithinimicrobium sp. Y1847 TaxID=3405419 RepID=UPI003B683030